MNPYIRNINKIEFAVTSACTGKCCHCSEGDCLNQSHMLSPEPAARAVYDICRNYEVKTVMTFGGEPLLNPQTVFAVHRAASEMNVPKRQLITNGYFSQNTDSIKKMAKDLYACGVNDVLLSADSFHQEYIPLDTVKMFAEAAADAGLPVRLQPAWLISPDHDNPYNRKTYEVLEELGKTGIGQNEVNIIFPAGNALKYLREYFDTSKEYRNPYEEDPKDIRTVSVSADGKVLGGNVNKSGILKIIEDYRPNE